MKFHVFSKKSKGRKAVLFGFLGIIALLAIVFLYRSYAIYEEQKNFNIMQGNIPPFIDAYDVKLAVTIDGSPSNVIPEKNSDKTVNRIVCDRNAKGTWDYENWKLDVDFKETRTKCSVDFVTKYKDSILNGADPVLSNGLIPVTIGNNGEVKKASLASEWYNYTNKVWANAIILFDENNTYSDGEVIPEENIESYFVWIPRYRYQIFNEGMYNSLDSLDHRERPISIIFETKDQGAVKGENAFEWKTHLAFTSFNTNGMWVGKFETGYLGDMAADDVNVNDSSKIQIKPNVYSWRGIQVSNAHLTSYGYKRSMDSHMMKNNEWGAVAYLSHSVYGLQSRIRINNNSSYITGYAAVNEPTCGYTATNEECNREESTALGVDGTYTVNYKNNQSVVASTTGNYSGIYDMSGGAWEYVMGVMMDSNGNLVSGSSDVANSGFVGILSNPSSGSNKDKTTWSIFDGWHLFPEGKYFEVYTYHDNNQKYSRRYLGDATGEMGPFNTATYGNQTRYISSWYQNEASFVNSYNPWFLRGGGCNLGIGSGPFAFNNSSGGSNSTATFRIVLSF